MAKNYDVTMKWNYETFANTLNETKDTLQRKGREFFDGLATGYPRDEKQIMSSDNRMPVYYYDEQQTAGGFKTSTELGRCLGASRPAVRVGRYNNIVARNTEAKHNYLRQRKASYNG